ncbi:uncharacterized protein VTP21DRAFT_8960 [Calcarisporiella thermophila]|uniref:uncharacterized protein n=1 Tax=Calcarisporiella thermophila TaxID=911321 RepID=UPI0037449CA2
MSKSTAKWKFWRRSRSNMDVPPSPTHATPSNVFDSGLMIKKSGYLFGVPLMTLAAYACVPISYVDGNEQCYGYIPIIVAKCGSFLKSQAVFVEGIFRISGSAKRVGCLQDIFDTPPTYGSDLNWRGYSVHDAANILRRFINYLPVPIIPHNFYSSFLSVMGKEMSEEGRVLAFQSLIEQIPLPHQYLLLYLLDLLSVFAVNSRWNRMDANNLASVFAPGILAPPMLAPTEYRLSQRVISFLIEHQSKFSIPQYTTMAALGPPPPLPIHAFNKQISANSSKGVEEELKQIPSQNDTPSIFTEKAPKGEKPSSPKRSSPRNKGIRPQNRPVARSKSLPIIRPLYDQDDLLQVVIVDTHHNNGKEWQQKDESIPNDDFEGSAVKGKGVEKRDTKGLRWGRRRTIAPCEISKIDRKESSQHGKNGRSWVMRERREYVRYRRGAAKAIPESNEKKKAKEAMKRTALEPIPTPSTASEEITESELQDPSSTASSIIEKSPLHDGLTSSEQTLPVIHPLLEPYSSNLASSDSAPELIRRSDNVMFARQPPPLSRANQREDDHSLRWNTPLRFQADIMPEQREVPTVRASLSPPSLRSNPHRNKLNRLSFVATTNNSQQEATKISTFQRMQRLFGLRGIAQYLAPAHPVSSSFSADVSSRAQKERKKARLRG